jgi:hypothetical protein
MTTNPGQTDPTTHPTPGARRDLSLPLTSSAAAPCAAEAWLLEYCSRVPGAVPARVEMAWPIENLEAGTVQLRVEGTARLSALGDRHGFTVVHCWWDVTGDELSVVALVAWFPPAGAAAGPLVLVEPELVAA